MTKQLREFAETILEHITKHDREMGPAYTRDYEREGGPALQEQYELAAAWLAEHHTDDDDPVGDLCDIIISSDRRIRIGIVGVGRIGAFYTITQHDGLCVDDVYLCDVKNRGDVRRLCRALGVEIAK